MDTLIDKASCRFYNSNHAAQGSIFSQQIHFQVGRQKRGSSLISPLKFNQLIPSRYGRQVFSMNRMELKQVKLEVSVVD
jgi:hypothetical protein